MGNEMAVVFHHGLSGLQRVSRRILLNSNGLRANPEGDRQSMHPSLIIRGIRGVSISFQGLIPWPDSGF
jgi:hypothetical protein